MKRMGSWYFEGYRRIEYTKPSGKTATRLEYIGEWYGFPATGPSQRSLKLRLLILALVQYLVYFYAQFNPSAGGMVHWLAIPSLLALVPMMWQVMGLFNFLPAKEKWELRVYYAGYRRLYRSSIAVLVLLAIWTGMEVVYTALHLSTIGAELIYLFSAILCTASAAVQVWIMRKYPAVVVEGPKIQ